MNFDLIHEIEWLLMSANISYELEQRIRSFLCSFDKGKLTRCRDYLKENQLEPRDPAKQFVSRMKIM
jgi:hypothetical protein